MAGYAQRVDLLGASKKSPVTTAKSKTYGDSVASRASQQAVPMGAAPDLAQMPVAPRRQLPTVSPLSGPSDRPNEPITAGMNFGPGPNAQQAGIPIVVNQQASAVDQLRQIVRMHPTDDLLDLLDGYGNEAT